MKSILVVFATRAGHTRRIAERLAAAIAAQGFWVKMVDAAAVPEELHLDTFCAAILLASVHIEKHEQEMIRFVKAHRTELERFPSFFLSVSLTEAAAENPQAPDTKRTKARVHAQFMIDQFLAETGWHPTRVKAVAGALLYSQYDFLLRFALKRLADHAWDSSDATRDHIYTDWHGLDSFVAELAREIPGDTTAREPA